ncbi:MAG TPA: ribonuclease T2, partial [Stellaceae bacterium]|nr:ribonuclease T2 [Stellaceae bacterium]
WVFADIRHLMRRRSGTSPLIAIVVLCLTALAGPASGQDAARGAPGRFDFYVLSLSWSPSFCADAAERHAGRSAGGECGARPYAFVVHGLWPQYEKGFPQYCQVPAPRIDHRLVSSMMDLMPAPHLIFNEWDKHGTCSGLSPRAYFETVRKARAAVTIPSQYRDLMQPLIVTPDAVTEAFVKANPGLTPNGVAVECSRKRLSEVRLCLSKQLQFRDCPDVARRSCRSNQLTMPPVRGG